MELLSKTKIIHDNKLEVFKSQLCLRKYVLSCCLNKGGNVIGVQDFVIIHIVLLAFHFLC
jgi:hypothetical protein